MFKQNDGLNALFDRRPPSIWQNFLRSPSLTLISALYHHRQRTILIPTPPDPITIVCISDTHNAHPSPIPEGDILIHAGDLTKSGTLAELQSTLDWLNTLPHPHKIVIAGNHDAGLDTPYPDCLPALSSSGTPTRVAGLDWGSITYLRNTRTTISHTSGRSLRIYGSPLTPRQGNWSFQYARDRDVWGGSPPVDIDVLVTHGPPRGHLDAGRSGCKFLAEYVWRAKPRLHVFGHVHEGHGVERVLFDGMQEVYERVVEEGGGSLWDVLTAVWEWGCAWAGRKKEARGVLVNAAIAGGRRDEVWYEPVVVEI